MLFIKVSSDLSHSQKTKEYMIVTSIRTAWLELSKFEGQQEIKENRWGLAD